LASSRSGTSSSISSISAKGVILSV
jgi:hypothetical protein